MATEIVNRAVHDKGFIVRSFIPMMYTQVTTSYAGANPPVPPSVAGGGLYAAPVGTYPVLASGASGINRTYGAAVVNLLSLTKGSIVISGGHHHAGGIKHVDVRIVITINPNIADPGFVGTGEIRVRPNPHTTFAFPKSLYDRPRFHVRIQDSDGHAFHSTVAGAATVVGLYAELLPDGSLQIARTPVTGDAAVTASLPLTHAVLTTITTAMFGGAWNAAVFGATTTSLLHIQIEGSYLAQ